MEIMRVENLTKVYGKGENEVRALDGVSFAYAALQNQLDRRN